MDRNKHQKRTEPVGIDPQKIRGLYTRLGRREAEDLICRATEKIAEHVRFLCNEDMSDSARSIRSARLIAELSGHIGMNDLSRIAGDVVACLLRADGPAVAATSARLGRISERSLVAIWELQGNSS